MYAAGTDQSFPDTLPRFLRIAAENPAESIVCVCVCVCVYACVYVCISRARARSLSFSLCVCVCDTHAKTHAYRPARRREGVLADLPELRMVLRFKVRV